MSLRATPNAQGVWQISGTVNGQRIRKSAKTRDGKIARALAKRMEREIAAEPEATDKVMFEQAALAYLRADGDKRFLAPLIVHFRGVDIRTIMQGHIEDAARALYPKRANATWNRNVLTPVRAVINFAAKRGWCRPIRLEMFEESKPHRTAGDRAWLDKFMAHASPEQAALALFMFTTGARISEALNMVWDDIDGRYVDLVTKTVPRRAVLTREMLAALAALDTGTGQDRVFRYKSKRWVYTKWDETCKRAGVKRLTPHEAGRHAFATEAVVRRGMDLPTAAALGGWSGTRLLAERYAHPENLVDRAEEAFGRPVDKSVLRQAIGKSGKK